MTDDRVLLMKQSGQVEKVETMLEEIQTTQHALAIVMEKIQNHLMKDGDPKETSSVEETPCNVRGVNAVRVQTRSRTHCARPIRTTMHGTPKTREAHKRQQQPDYRHRKRKAIRSTEGITYHWFIHVL